MRSRMLSYLGVLTLTLPWAIGASAQAPTPPPQFAFTGFIQAATLDTTGAICTPPNDPGPTGKPSDRLRGGTMTVNGIKMIVPCNSIVQFPASTFSWGDLFDPAISAPVGSYIGAPAVPVLANPTVLNTKLGLALSDNPMPFPAFEVTVNGNVVNGKYIVGLIVPIEQQVLNASSGLVSYIDYKIGAFRVGGIPNDPNSGSLVQINDPVTDAGPDGHSGRWGLTHSPDPRFSGDFENTTVHASTGIPVCIPRVAPPAIDTECPLKNRPLNGSRFGSDPFLAANAPLKIFTMPTPAQADADPKLPDPRKQVPIMIGDQVNYIGTLYKINPLGDNTPANTYISSHTVEDVLGIFTAPGVPPAYVTIESMLIGTGGASIAGLLQEASTRLTVVGFTTDPTRLVNTYAIDVNPCTGQETLRLLATTDPASDALVGRFVHRVLGGDFMPATRMYVMKTQTQALDNTGKPVPLIAANGIATGQFALPNFEYVFPENHRLGDPILPNNYQDMPFLALGQGPLDAVGIPGAKNGDPTSPTVGQLTPWPGTAPYNPAPAPVDCTNFGHSPIVKVGPDRAAGTGTTVTLAGTVTWDANDTASTRTPKWTQVNTGAPTVTLATPTRVNVGDTSTVTTTFHAPTVPTTLTFQLTGTDNFGSGNDAVSIVVLAKTDVVQITAATWVIQKGKVGPFGKLGVTATTSDPTAILSLSQVSVDGTIIDWGTGSNTPADPTTFNWVEIKGAAQPKSLTVTSTKGGTAKVTCGAPNAVGIVTCP